MGYIPLGGRIMKVGLTVLIRVILNRKNFLESIICIFLEKLLRSLLCNLNDYENNNNVETLDKIEKMAITMSRIKKSVIIAQTVFNTMLKRSANYSGNAVKDAKSSNNINGVNKVVNVRGQRKTNDDVIHAGMIALYNWGKGKNTPDEFIKNESVFIKK